MNYEDFDGWDESFLDEAIRAEEQALAGRSAVAAPEVEELRAAEIYGPSFSPPRELSQRVPTERRAAAVFDFFADVDFEASQLLRPFPSTTSRSVKDIEKSDAEKDLGRVSRQLNQLRRELSEIRGERDKKEELLKSAMLKLEARDAELVSVKKELEEQENSMRAVSVRQLRGNSLNQVRNASLFGTADAESNRWNDEKKLERTTSCEDCNVRENAHMDAVLLKVETKCTKTTRTAEGLPEIGMQGTILPETTERLKKKKMLMKAIGVQTDLSDNSSTCVKDTSFELNLLSYKLLEVWGSPSSRRFEGNILPKLFASSASDMIALFRSVGTSTSIIAGKRKCHSDIVLPVSLIEPKLQQLEDNLTKAAIGILPVEAILEVLIDLTDLDDEFLVYASLRSLRVFSQQMLIFPPDSNSRDNIMFTSSDDSLSAEEKNIKSDYPPIMKVGHVENLNSKEEWKPFTKKASPSMASTDMQTDLITSGCELLTCLIFFFEKMHQITQQWTQENIRVEALIIMNMILMRSDPHAEREKYGSESLFGSLIVLLKKEAGLGVQTQSVHLLFLLLNCPALMKMFCMDKDVMPVEEPSNLKDVPPINESFGNRILDCLALCFLGDDDQYPVLKLRKRIIVLLAFMASSGKSGFELLVRRCSKGGMTFIELIVQTLAVELDAEGAMAEESHETCKERLQVIREALILLNRLASNPAYSTSVLGFLTSSRAMAILTADVIDRLSRKNRKFELTDTADGKEAEIIDLARVLKVRFYAFLGVDIS